MSDLEKKLRRDSLNYFISKAMPGFMGLLSILVFVRLVGAAQYGRYAVTLSVVMAFAVGTSGWLTQGILRFHSRYEERNEASTFERALLLGSLASIVLGSLVSGLVLWLFGGQSFWMSVLGMGILAAVFLYMVLLARWRAMLRSGRVVWLEAFRSVAAFAIPIVVVLATGSTHYSILLVGVLAGYLLPVIGYPKERTLFPRVMKNSVQPGDWRSAQPLLRELWLFGWPISLWFLCSQMLAVSDRYMIQMFLGYSAAGVYSSIYDTIVRSFSLLFFPITLASHPLIMSLWNRGDRRSSLSVIRTSVKYQTILYLPVFVLLVSLAPWVSYLVLGKDDTTASTIILPLALGGFLAQISLLVHKPLEIMCRTKRMLFANMAALAVSIVGNYLFIPIFGYQAAAYVFVAATFTYLVTVVILTPYRGFLRKIAASPASAPVKSTAAEFK